MFKKLSAVLILSLIAPITATAQAAFTSADQVRMILDATKGSWIAVREYDGNDLLYFTHLESWRCGLDGVKYGINSDVADQIWDQEDCYMDEATPNAIKMQNGLPYITLPLGSVESVTIEILYDDGQTDTVTYERAAIQIQ